MAEETRIPWYRSPIDKATLARLTERSDAQGFFHLIGKLLLVSVTGTLTWLAWKKSLPVPLIVLAVYAHCTLYTFLGPGGPVHELCHGTVFRTRFWNEFFLRITSFLSWTSYVFFRTSHAKHHQLTVYHELDLEIILPQKMTKLDWLEMWTVWVRGIVMLVWKDLRHSLGVLKGEWEERIFPATNPKLRRRLFWWARITLGGHTALGVLFVLSGNWILLLLVTFAPFIALWLNHLCGFTQHAGLVPDVPDFRLCCRTVLLSRPVRFLYSYMNYHVEHHMFAAVPFYNLPKLRAAIEHDLPPASPSLPAAWREILPILRKQRSDPSYVHVPVLPGPGREAAGGAASPA